MRLRTLLLLRWLAVIGQTSTVLFVAYVLGFELEVGLALAVIAVSAWLNIALSIGRPASRLLSDGEAAAQLVFDVLQLTSLLALTGGVANPFVVLVGAPVVIASTSLRAPYAIGLAGLALAASGLMTLWRAPLPWIAGETFAPPPIYVAGLWMALVTGAGFMSVFAWRAGADARRMSTALRATEAVLAREQRLSALGGLAAAAAHELGTPLGTIHLVAKDISRMASEGTDLREDADLLVTQSERCRDILKQLSRRGAEEDAIHAKMTLRAFLEEAIEPLGGLGKQIEVVFEPPTPDDRPPTLRRSPEMLYAIGNYLENAIDYAAETIVLTGRWMDDWLEIEVRDDGPGFPPDLITKLGEPYITKRDGATAGGGLGLGFFIAKTFVERMGGRVSFGNRRPPASGAIVRARWPMDRVRASEP